MDAFKLLTRSTKFNAGSAKAKSSISNHLPSAGEAATPQLFPSRRGKEPGHNDEVKGKKRKRGADHKLASDNVTLDFFGAEVSPHASVPKKSKGDGSGAQEREGTSEDEDDTTETTTTTLSEEECKAILNSHKIKISDLRTPIIASVAEEEEEPSTKESEKKKKKKKKKQKLEPELEAPLTRKQRKMAQRLYPEPLTEFSQLRTKYQISRRLAENIAKQGYSVPTEVQLGSLPLLLGECARSPSQSAKGTEKQPNPDLSPDLLVVAPTGSGKTLAFMIPLINGIVVRHHKEPGFKGILAVVLAPTKELVAQIVNEARKLTAGTGVRVTAMRKGMQVVENRAADIPDEKSDEEDDEDQDEESADEEKQNKNVTITKSDILVSTPLQLANSLSGNKKHDIAPLPSVQNLVLDEADVLLDPLFRDQTLDVWRACTNPQLRVGLWSATMGSNIEELAKTIIKDRQSTLGLKDEFFLIRLVIGLKDSAIPNIAHKLVYAATEQGKLLGLRQLLHPTGAGASSTTHLRPPFIVFTQTITRAVALHSELKYDIPAEAGGSSRIAVLHSELSDSRRSDVMAGFRKGEIWILITTDLLSRGVDFRGINGVVNYDIPNSSAAYVHRVGRTGRAGREGGVAVTFYTKDDIPYVKGIANVISASEKLRGVKGDEAGIQKWLLDALPDLSKNAKKDLKKYGVNVRRPAADKDDKESRRTRISTKSGFERRVENNRRGAIQGSQRRKLHDAQPREGNESDNGSWDGIED
ncbi:hypothetical protein AJ80_01802 [Polytolypa hystricis UAMH7299]|uniref:ATP-dependent RNA helicase ROK1 n=1 Tax=Polytolypa hystricis (strain UAMH7299) TaxID=1447883 RepID=A0A2B7Z031_POLH7|nr:hypothetical protein AJ80_01802 [Polytolypa hystricis UAMH7299]